MSEEFDYMSATELRLRIGKKQISPLELTIRSLEKAESVQETLNPFYSLMADRAVDEAKAAERALMSGTKLGKLHGLPMSVKDLISVSDAPFSFGSQTLAENIADSDAPAVERVRKSGAIIIGKTTTSEFGCKPVGDSPLTGITRNPWNINMTPGGSSAGAAASIAAGVTSIGLGTDGGGSIRIQSAFTGLGAPYWDANSRGVLCGLTRDTGPKEIVRAVIESVAYQTYDLFEAMKNDGLRPKVVKVDGGMVNNNWFTQYLSDIVDVKVCRPKVNETTALGAAFMAGLKIGVYKSLKDISKKWKIDKSFFPKMKSKNRKELLKGWSQAIRKTLTH